MLLRVHFSLGYGIQERARDTQRKHDIKTIARALEMNYIEHGSYPIISGTYYWHSTYPIDGNTANTFVPDSWNELKEHLSPYIDDIGDDPKKQRGPSAIDHAGRYGYGYDYASQPNAERCNIPQHTGQTYHLFYKFESEPQVNEITGNCTYLAPNSTTVSSYTVVKP